MASTGGSASSKARKSSAEDVTKSRVSAKKKAESLRRAKVRAQACQPSAKARALLRDKEIAARDLSTSGGAYSLEQVQSLLHDITRQAVNKRVRDGTLLAVPGPSNRLSYPVVQFTDDGTPVEGLREVREALGTENSWMILNFLVNPDSKLGNRTPIDLMKAGKLQHVLEVARCFSRTSRRLSMLLPDPSLEAPADELLTNYARSLLPRLSEATRVPRRAVEGDEWKPRPNACHRNAEEWVQMNREWTAVHGWLVADCRSSHDYVDLLPR